MDGKRTKIFLSHATPEDNECTRWLAAKLTLAGYEVWCDFDELKGGDHFWEKIEAVIRNQVFRLIAVVSPASYQKDGVRKEWALAATIEKRYAGFTIPIRVGNFRYSELPIILHQKNVLNFDAGWHIGLHQLLDTLKTAGAPRSEPNDPAGALNILRQGQSLPQTLTDQEEVLESNWLALRELPSSVEASRILSSQREIKLTERNRMLPWFEIEDRIVGFSRQADMVALFHDHVPLKPAEAFSTEEFLSGSISFRTRVDRRDAQNRITYLIRQAWDLLAERKGLRPYPMANGATAWYVPLGLLPKEKAAFTDIGGEVRRRQLAGTSTKYRVNWHYGLTAYPVLNDPHRLELHSHVIFSNLDGTLVEVPRMHRLRRGFCRNWWNDRWRGFLRGSLSYLSDGEPQISLPVGSGRAVLLDALPMRYLSPVGLNEGTLEESEEIELDAQELDPDDFEPLGEEEESE